LSSRRDIGAITATDLGEATQIVEEDLADYMARRFERVPTVAVIVGMVKALTPTFGSPYVSAAELRLVRPAILGLLNELDSATEQKQREAPP